MGLSKQSQQQGGNFISVKYGSLIIQGDENSGEDFERLEVTKPNTNPPETVIKYVQRFGSLDGRIVNISWYDTEDTYEGFRFMGVKIKIRDSEDVFILDLKFGTKPYNTFVKCMENLNFEKDVQFNVWVDKKTDKTAFLMRQKDASGKWAPIKWKYTRENPGDCPPPRPKKPTGWDFSEQTEWLYDKLMEVIIPKVKELNPNEVEDEAEHVAPDLDDLAISSDEPVEENVEIPFLTKEQNKEYDESLKKEKASEKTGKKSDF